jgi:hypothetical protein
MDKSFNEQELSDIMKEIEALEENLTQASEMKTLEVMGPIEASSPVLQELAALDEEDTTPEEDPILEPAQVVSIESKRVPEPVHQTERPHTSMNFKVQGNLTIELQFDIGGKVVCLEVTENGLAIEMEGGVKFTVPVSQKKAV